MTRAPVRRRMVGSQLCRSALCLLLVACSTSTADYFSGRFACNRRTGDWGLFKQQPDGPELVACFGGFMRSEDDEAACKAVLRHANIGPGFHCAAFQ